MFSVIVFRLIQSFSVQYETEHIHLCQRGRCQSLFDISLIRIILTHDKYAAGHTGRQDQGIRHDIHWRHVQYDQIIGL